MLHQFHGFKIHVNSAALLVYIYYYWYIYIYAPKNSNYAYIILSMIDEQIQFYAQVVQTELRKESHAAVN